jgi:hypothetical protein
LASSSSAVTTPFYMPNSKACREQDEDRTMVFKKEVAQLNRQLQIQAGEVFDIYKRAFDWLLYHEM